MSCRKPGLDGSLIPMAEQDRSRRDRNATAEGIALVTAALPRGPIGPYQLQAAIAALHDEAQSPEATDWPQIAALYDVLLRLDDDPVVAPNHAAAISMVAGPRAGLELVRPRAGPASRYRPSGQRRSSLLRGPRPPRPRLPRLASNWR
jgi:predicted RNA polymerase sigma factor